MYNIIAISIATGAIILIVIADSFGLSAVIIIATQDAVVSNSIG